MAFSLVIETDNAAFHSQCGLASCKTEEIVRILRKTASQLSEKTVDKASTIVYDDNGNAIGSWHLDQELKNE